jgi:uncharacterized repeat protein (TIGR01451 family)
VLRSARIGGVSRCASVAALVAVAFVIGVATPAAAAPVMQVYSSSNTTVAPGGQVTYYVSVHNVGDQSTAGDLTLQAAFPAGLSALSVQSDVWDCSSTTFPASTVTCTFTGTQNPFQVGPPDDARVTFLQFTVEADPSATGTLTSLFAVSGGNVTPASTVDPITVANTPPAFGIDGFDGQVIADAAGDPFTQAGGHPYAAATTIFFNTLTNPAPLRGDTWPVEQAKDLTIDLPAGFLGDPTATGARCTQAQLAPSGSPLCPPGSQIGVTTIFSSAGKILGNPLPVFNLVPPPDVPARFGFNVLGNIVTLDASIRSGGDYGATVEVHGIPEGLAITGTSLTLWGVPADASHDLERSCAGEDPPSADGPHCSTEAPRRPFLRNPTSCTPAGVGLLTTLQVDSWVTPGLFKSATFVSHNPPGFPYPQSDWGAPVGTTGCDLVPFEPAFAGAPDDATTGAPTAFSFDLTLPQSDDPDGTATADLKRAVVTLPKGLRVSPSSAAGLKACTPAQIKLHSDAAPTCPGASKIGTLAIDTPLLDDPLTGSIYLAKPHDNPFGTLLALYLVAKGHGVVVKLAGKVSPDPATGQLTTTFDDNPQLPFSKLHLEFKGGPRAPLSNPLTCGTYTTHAALTSWSGKTVDAPGTFTVSADGNGTPCGKPRFSPQLNAGVDDVRAGKHTSFEVQLTRQDTDQELSSLTVHAPRGLLADVAHVPLCPAARANAGTCGDASRIGSVLTGAGAGTNPFYLPGKVYLTGPYKGGPFGLSIVVPAIAGPFDLGVVVVRASIQVDRHTAQLNVVSDPLPRILDGIPLQLRDIRVTVDRSGFVINPTSCLQKQVTASFVSTGGLHARASSPFRVGGCAKVPLRPRMSLTVGGNGHTTKGASTPLNAVLTQTPGQAGLKSVSVTLPLSINAQLDVVNHACTEEQFTTGHCEDARAGSAVAVTPLLKHALRGGVYFVHDPSKPTGSLPNLIVALRGQVDFDLVGTIKLPRGQLLETQFKAVPDVPIKRFSLSLVSGSHGPIAAAENLCSPKARHRSASIVFTGQNGIVIHRHSRLRVRGCSRRRA